jgi:hypothetical protein
MTQHCKTVSIKGRVLQRQAVRDRRRDSRLLPGGSLLESNTIKWKYPITEIFNQFKIPAA